MFVLEGHRFAAVVAQHGRYGVHRAALRAGLLFGSVGIDSENRSARTAIGAQVVQPFELAALALPVADRVLDELELRGLAKVSNREHRSEHGLKSGVLPFSRKQIHLQEPVIRLSLNL